MNKDEDEFDIHEIPHKLASLSDSEFLNLGHGNLAYIRSVDGEPGLFTLSGADGTHIATGQDLDVLQVIAKENKLILLTTQ